MFKLNYLRIPLLYIISFIFLIFFRSTSDNFAYGSEVSKEYLYSIWIKYFSGMIITFISVGIFQNIFKKNIQQLIKVIIKLRNAFLKKIINSSQVLIYKNISYSDILNFFIIGIGLYMCIASLFHYLDTSSVEVSRIFSRYYITRTRQSLFIISSVCSFFQIILKTKLKKLSYLNLILGSITQAFVDNSRFFIFPLILIGTTLFFNNNRYKKNKIFNLNIKNFFKITKSNLLKLTFFALFGLITFKLLNARFREIIVVLDYFSSASFYNIGIINIPNTNFNYSNLCITLLGLPLKLINYMGIDYGILRIDVYRPLPGILQLYNIHNSFFMSGVLTALILILPVTLMKFINLKVVKFFCMILLFSTLVTLPQYDLRSSTRILQLLLFTSLFSL